MKRTCIQCGKRFEARSHRAQTCSNTCRSRKNRGKPPEAQVVQLVRPLPAHDVEVEGGFVPAGIFEATVSTLVRLGLRNTVEGQLALKLAARLDDADSETGSGLAALSKELHRVLGALNAMMGTQGTPNPLDAIRVGLRIV